MGGGEAGLVWDFATNEYCSVGKYMRIIQKDCLDACGLNVSAIQPKLNHIIIMHMLSIWGRSTDNTCF